MSERRFAKFKIAELEKLFDQNLESLDTLQSIGAELFYRTSKRAKALLERVTKAISVLPKFGEGEGK